MARKSDVANVKVDVEAGIVAFAFSPACGGDTVTVSPNDLPENVQKWAAFHGINQKLRDSYAGKDGKDAREAFDRVLEALTSGKLTTRGEGDGAPVGVFAEAFHLFLVESGRIPADTDRKATKALLAKMDDEKKKAIRGSKQIVEIIARLAQAKASKNADELLADVDLTVAA